MKNDFDQYVEDKAKLKKFLGNMMKGIEKRKQIYKMSEEKRKKHYFENSNKSEKKMLELTTMGEAR